MPSHGGRGNLVPVLLTFSGYRQADFNLVTAITEQLHRQHFRSDDSAADSDQARAFTIANLPKGNLLVLIDALDELEGKDRLEAVRRVVSDIALYPEAAVILSCRTAAWHGQISDADFQVVKMADFTASAVRQFLHNWGFTPPKSNEELLHVIDDKPHIALLSRNPLTLTILAFLYGQVRYSLPENRAQFYEVCSRALLEEWDQSRAYASNIRKIAIDGEDFSQEFGLECGTQAFARDAFFGRVLLEQAQGQTA